MQISAFRHTHPGTAGTHSPVRTGSALGIRFRQADSIGPFLPGPGKAKLCRIRGEASQQLAASVEEISATLQQISAASEQLLQMVQDMLLL